MSWVIDHTSRVHFKANWTREEDLRRALQNVIDIQALKRDPNVRLRPYHTEGITYLKGGTGSPVPGDPAGEGREQQVSR